MDAIGKEFMYPCSFVEAGPGLLSEPKVSTCPLLLERS
jgi:hypothetical protein